LILDTIKKYLRIDRREICFLKFIPGCAEDVKIILQDLKKNFIIEDASAETSENR